MLISIGSVLATSIPDLAYSDKSFGSTGSGGATVDRRNSLGSHSSVRPPNGPPGKLLLGFKLFQASYSITVSIMLPPNMFFERRALSRILL